MSNTSKSVITAAVVALVTSLVAFAVYTTTIKTSTPAAPAPVILEGSEELGAISGVVLEAPYVFKNGASFGSDHLAFTRNGTIPAGSNEGFWRNTTGRTVYVDLAEMVTTGTASSTYDFFAGTTTAASISDDFTDPFSGLIDDALVATSTPATLVNSIVGGGGSNDKGVVAVANGAYVFFTFQQTYDNACTGALCETATSTNRGFNVSWYLRGHFKP